MRALPKIIHRKRSRQHPHCENKIISAPEDLHNLHPDHEQKPHINTLQAGYLAVGYVTFNGGFELQLAGVLEREGAGVIEMDREFAGGGVEIVAGDPFGKKTSWEDVVLQDLVCSSGSVVGGGDVGWSC